MRIAMAILIMVATAGFVVAIYAAGLDRQSVTGRDYIQYWAAERLLTERQNPYDPALILREQRAAGMTDTAPKVTLSPPIAFFWMLPLGAVGAKTGLIGWLVLSMGALCLSIFLVWHELGRQTSGYHFIGLCFPPALCCLMAGQLGIFFLLGMASFLRLVRTRPWLAGAALFPCALKPHLFLPLAVALALWSLRRKEPRVAGGFFLALAVSSGLTLWIDPRIWSEYRQILHAVPIMDVFLPTASVALRFAIDRHAHWIEFVPEAAAGAWAVWYSWRERTRWDWARQGMLLLMVSLAVAPYCWYSDQAVLLPAVLAGIYAAEKKPLSWVLLGAMMAGGMVGVIAAINLPSPFYVWTAPAWLGWYLYATAGANRTGAAEAARGLERSYV